MPDWFYRTVSRPILFRLPARAARDFALGFMGRLARLPLGSRVIDFLGHMRADERLRQSLLGIDFPTSVGLGPWLDTNARALPALARFGFGFLEVGPVTVEGSRAGRTVERLYERQALWFDNPPDSLSLKDAAKRLAEASRMGLPLIARLGITNDSSPQQADDESLRLIQELAPHAQAFSLSTLGTALDENWRLEQWRAHIRALVEASERAATPRPLLLCVTADVDMASVSPFIEAALEAGVSGLIVDGSVKAQSGGLLVGLPAREAALEQVRSLRERLGSAAFIIASGGIHEPEDALRLKAAGASLVQVDSGLVYTGPALPKRINDAFLFEATRNASRSERHERVPELTWFWTTLMGAGMLFGSLLALVIAATKVVLPYDEAFVGMTREALSAVNPRLLAFMAHDRISLAGTMVAIGAMYVGLSVFGIRRGLHWARQAVFVSAFTGFLSFFLFLGFGYLDTFHAFVTGALLQLLLLGVHARLGLYIPGEQADLRGDRAWRLSLWGQFLLVIHGFALLAAGAAISTVGVTQVFVHEDLEFMRTTADALRIANPRLVPLIAHDRATFGGMLLSSGWVFLLPALWGFRRGHRWLWCTLLIAGLAAYSAAIGVHYAVGYMSLMHLLPALGGLTLFLLGLGLSYSFLWQRRN
ncbi:MAG: dihydroorotate dehydrogenase [Pyrinomonadaceae bacterium]|nr:dihydroorotate dehydrogenase [Pyrinomonadaceae bacterium]